MNIESILMDGEEVLWQGKGVPNKTRKNTLTFSIFIIIFIVLLFVIISSIGKNGNGLITGLVFIVVFLLFIAIFGYGIFYNCFIKNKKIQSEIYYLTNKRAIIYDSEAVEFSYGFLEKFEEICVDNQSGSFGDINMSIEYKETGDSKKDGVNIAKLMFKPDKTDMPVISFKSIEKPRKIIKLIREAKKNLVSIK